MRGRLPGLLAVVAYALLAPAAGAPAAIPQGNTLLNGTGETGTAVADDASHVCPQGWICDPTFPNTTLVRYGTGLFPSAAESARIGGANNFFAGGPSNNLSGATQRIELGEQPEFNAGTVKATFSGCLGGLQSQGDRALIQVTFFTRENPDTGINFAQYGPTAAERGNETKLLPAAQTVAVPPQAFAFRFTLSFVREGEGYNDGYADNLSVTFGPASDPDPPAAGCAVPAGGGPPAGGAPGTPAGPDPGTGAPGTGTPGTSGTPGPSGGRAPVKLLGFGSALIGRDGKARVRVTCKTTQLTRCRGTVSASLSGTPSTGKGRIVTAAYSIPSSKSAVVKIAVPAADLRRIRGFSKRALATRRLRLVATTRSGTLRFKQTTLVKLTRPRLTRAAATARAGPRRARAPRPARAARDRCSPRG